MTAALVAARDVRLERKRAPLDGAQTGLNVGVAGVFEGYASVFDVADLGGDIVARGAFRDSLVRRGAAGIKLLWQHESAEPIGAWLRIEEDHRGLKVRGRLNLAVARAREVLALMREGAVDGLSIGFRTQKSALDRATGFRVLQKIDLQEISIVTFPMLPQARVTAVKRASRGGVDRVGLSAARMTAARRRWRASAAALEHAMARTGALERRYSLDQPRDDHGRWTSGGGERVRIADASPAASAGDMQSVVDAECEAQYDLDAARCRTLGSRVQRAKCWNSAAERFGACLGRRPIPTLRF